MTNRSNAVLLVGGSGFLGLALAQSLADQGREVHVLSRHTEPRQIANIAFHRGSQDDPEVVTPLLKSCGTVVHLASTTTPGSSARYPVVDTEENLLPATRLVDLMTRHPPKRLVFVSSGGSIYGDPRQNPVDELAAPQPISYHAAGKLALESLFSAFAHSSSVSLGILRPSNLYGPGQRLRNGFGLIRTLFEKALRHEPVEMWGDGTAERDYLFIDDAVQACIELINNADAIGPFNAGTGSGTSIVDLIGLVEAVIGRKLDVVARPARCTDVKAIVLSCARLQVATGWQPQITLETGLQKTWDWLRCNSR